MGRIMAGLIAALMLSGCIPQDNSPHAVGRQYQEMEFAYERCLGRLQYEREDDTFPQRLACTQAVYGGSHD